MTRKYDTFGHPPAEAGEHLVGQGGEVVEEHLAQSVELLPSPDLALTLFDLAVVGVQPGLRLVEQREVEVGGDDIAVGELVAEPSRDGPRSDPHFQTPGARGHAEPAHPVREQRVEDLAEEPEQNSSPRSSANRGSPYLSIARPSEASAAK
ncbi:hypothetical protein ACFU78_21930 [Streptomyces tendae]|uniref:hypothetical protein n=1 Tax=Streptomyces tendae TaxID=1932 RepID=UPI00367EBBF4